MKNTIERLRTVIDNIDALIIKLLNKRLKTSSNIQKIKNDGLGFSPARERQILMKCQSTEIKNIYANILSNSRKIPGSIKWCFLRCGDIKKDRLALENFNKIFGRECYLKLKKITGRKGEKIKYRHNTVIITALDAIDDYFSSNGPQFVKYCEYQRENETLFSFYYEKNASFEPCHDIIIKI